MELPVYKMVLTPGDDSLGVHVLSLVETPAIMVNWVKFADQKPAKFAIQDEEQRIVFGPVLIPDLPIYRNQGGKEFHLTIDAPTIKQVALLSSQKQNLNNYDTNHNGVLLKGMTMLEQVITDEKRFPYAVGYEDLPIGTLFRTSKVDDEETWNRIKAGELNGYSIDGLFNFKMSEELTDKEVQSITKDVLGNFF